jgi:hypothetical protein
VYCARALDAGVVVREDAGGGAGAGGGAAAGVAAGDGVVSTDAIATADVSAPWQRCIQKSI